MKNIGISLKGAIIIFYYIYNCTNMCNVKKYETCAICTNFLFCPFLMIVLNSIYRAAWSGSLLFGYGNMMIYDPTQVDL